jgi:hypothetical protein
MSLLNHIKKLFVKEPYPEEKFLDREAETFRLLRRVTFEDMKDIISRCSFKRSDVNRGDLSRILSQHGWTDEEYKKEITKRRIHTNGTNSTGPK